MPKRTKKDEEVVTQDNESDPFPDVHKGPLRDRSFGLRVDDDIEVQIIAGNSLISMRGRILSLKDDLEIVDEDGYYHKVVMDWIVDTKVIRHNRPSPEKDPEMIRRPLKAKLKKPLVDHAYY
ncbi:MAG: hypothetical protein QCI82_02825 [Candidatus Thermoplasmatota archaeon]|nr:hypothetical protein [Candidatus Thermoplasmatota archaeon]